jgi:hydrogenase expression/formation protein HypD
MTRDVFADAAQVRFRDPVRARALAGALGRVADAIGRDRVTLMHVCGSHEQAIARFGLRAVLPKRLDLVMGPGCPVCITDMPEIDEAVALALHGVHVATYGDMVRVPGTVKSLADARAEGARVHVIYSVQQAIDLARATPDEVAFFATGFETTAVATAAVLLRDPPPNFSVLSAHKFVPPAMEAVMAMPEARIEGFLAAGHAAVITGWGLFEEFARRHRVPVVVAGFEPLDILGALVRLAELVRDGEARAVNMYPRCVSREGNRVAQAQLWRVFRIDDGEWRGIAHVPGGNLRLREEWAHVDARRRFAIDPARARDREPSALAAACICGRIMAGLATPLECRLFGRECAPDVPVGACMVSSEGTCRIWHQYGGRPELEVAS